MEGIFEVAVEDGEGNDYFPLVKTDDEDRAVEKAMITHWELGRSDPVWDFDEGVFPMAHEPPIEDNEPEAVEFY